MMKKGKISAIIVIALVACVFAMAGCSKSVESVSLNKATLTLAVGSTETLTATVTPADATTPEVTWSTSDANIATVDTNGKVTGVAKGEAVITVTTEDGGMTDKCTVTVIIPVASVSLDKTEVDLVMGGSGEKLEETLVATVNPGDANNKNVTWSSSDDAVATVDSNGKVTAKSSGTATITVTTADGSKTAECEVTVTVVVTGVALDKESSDLAISGSLTLVATISPAGATNKSVTWESSDTGVATVANGVVTPVANGTTTITVTTADGSFTDTCVITVFTPVDSVSLNKSALELVMGGSNEKLSETLVATVLPATASNSDITWESSNPSVATVVNGLIAAVSKGTATITVKTVDGEKIAECEVTVLKGVTGVSLNHSTLTIKEANVEQLTATILPADASNQNLIWSTSNAAAAIVDQTGLVSAVLEGTATITVKTEDGEFTATCVVTVEGFNAKVGEWAISAELTQGHVAVANSINSLVTFTAPETGKLYYSANPALTTRSAIMADAGTTMLEVVSGQTYYLKLNIASTSVLKASMFLVEDSETINANTLVSNLFAITWTADDFITIDPEAGITTWAALKAALAVNENITLAANIDAGKEVFEGTLAGYNKTFDGKGFFIVDINLVQTATTRGLFSTLSGGAVIKDITFLNPVMTGANFTKFALIAGDIANGGTGGVQITNVDILNYYFITGSTEYKGVFFGSIANNHIVTFTDCDVYGIIKSSAPRVGVIVGYHNNGSVVLNNCDIDVTFSDDSTNNLRGAIVGHGFRPITINDSTITTYYAGGAGTDFGGIAGNYVSANSNLSINRSIITTTFASTCTGTKLGGIVGYYGDQEAKIYLDNSVINVTFNQTTSANQRGGIIGVSTNNNKKALTVSLNFCYVTVNAGASGAKTIIAETNFNATDSGTPMALLKIDNSIIVTTATEHYVWTVGVDAVSETTADFAATAAEINGTIAASFVDDEVNVDGHDLWTYTASPKELKFLGGYKTPVAG